MIHSASFFATGSEIDASACVASSGLCLRTRSMTSSSCSMSSLDVAEVAATAAGATCLRVWVGAVTFWRAGGAGAAIGGGKEGEASSRAGAVAACGGTVGGTELRATGRAWGFGTSCFFSDAVVFLSDAVLCFLSEAFLSELFLSGAFFLSVVFLSEFFLSEAFLSEVFFSEVLAAGVSVAVAAGLSEAGAASTRQGGASARPTARIMIVASAGERRAAARAIGVNGIPCGESII